MNPSAVRKDVNGFSGENGSDDTGITKEMLAELPTDCDVGTQKNSKGYKQSWTGYKLHIDVR